VSYRSGSYSQDSLLTHPCKLDCGIPAADGLDNNFRLYISAGMLKPAHRSGIATVESFANHGARFPPVKMMQISRLSLNFSYPKKCLLHYWLIDNASVVSVLSDDAFRNTANCR
jgi:hypothetical protein